MYIHTLRAKVERAPATTSRVRAFLRGAACVCVCLCAEVIEIPLVSGYANDCVVVEAGIVVCF